MRLLRASAVLVLTLAAAVQVRAADSRAALLVDAAWLAGHLSDGDLVLLEIGPERSYAAGHIPGARFVAAQTLATSDPETGNTLQMLPAPLLRERLAALGISDSSHVVVYFSGEWVSPATRVVFTLDYAGIARVSLLDGGIDAWTRAGRPLTAEVPEPKIGRLAPFEAKPLVVDAAFVKAHLDAPGFAIVDARTSGFFDGSQTGGGQAHPHRTGHIAGAHSIPFSETVDAGLSLKPAGELAALFAKAGVKPGDTVITYCHIGQQATATLFAARTLGYRVLLYDGSFEDWSRHAGYPVENPSAKRD